MKIPKLVVKKFTLKNAGNVDINMKDKIIKVAMTNHFPQYIDFSDGVVQEYREAFNSRGEGRNLQEYAMNFAKMGVKAAGVTAALV